MNFSTNGEVWFQLGRHRNDLGDIRQAEFFFSRAIELMANVNPVPPEWWYGLIISFFRQHGETDKAIAALRQAVVILPMEVPFHLQMGDYYLSQGITVKAAEEFKQALLLDPGNGLALERLQEMKITK